tara:strand:+ start:97 stop:399 length:303 start_codon:yes stop_codon:yes gene_type:complete
MTTATATPSEKKEEKIDPYESMIQDRLAMLQEQYNQFERPEYLEDEESKIVPFIMIMLSELFVRQDIIMDKMYARDLPDLDEDLNIKEDDATPPTGSVNT